jgi:acyl carrier protein
LETDEIERELTGVFQSVMDRDDIVLTPETTADDIEEWDSLSHIRLMVAVEKRFGIRFTNAEVEGLKNVGNLVKLITTKRNSSSK